MSAILPPLPIADCPEPAPNRIRWTRQQCRAMQEAGILTGRYELVDGEILSKMGQNPPHSSAIMLLIRWLNVVFGADCVRSQLPIVFGKTMRATDEPEPDIAVTRDDFTHYTSRHPEPDDLLLVIEVSDTTLAFDLTTKAKRYARAGIADYWVQDLNRRRIIVHRNPKAGKFSDVTVYTEDETIAPLAKPEAIVRVADLLLPV